MIQRYFIIRGPVYSNALKYVCVLRNDFLYVVRVHSFRIFIHRSPWVICSISVSINSGIPLYYNTEYFVSVSSLWCIPPSSSRHIP